MPLPLLPTSLVGSYAQPDWLIDRQKLAGRFPPRVRARELWRIAPEFSEALPDLPEMLDIADAALIIGDPALRISLGIAKDGWPGAPGQTVCPAATLGITSCELLYVSDVVGEWRALTRRPAVLAVWALGRELATAELGADFLASRDFGLAHLGEISYEAARDLELPQRALESYLRDNIDFSLDAENRRGLELYFEHAAKLGLIRKAEAIHWAAAKSEAVKL